MPKWDGRGAELVANGNKRAVCAAGNNSVSTVAGARLVRLWSLSGTGSVDVYDNAVGDTSGTHLYSLAATTVGTVITLDVPCTSAGIAVVVGASTTVVVVYEE